MAASPTQLTLKLLRDQGFVAEVVERWIPGANIRKDLFGFVDIVAVDGKRTVGVQATSASNMSARKKKIMESEVLGLVRSSGWEIWVMGWKKVGTRWEHRVVEIV